MKKVVYISICAFIGLMMSIIIHGVLEVPILLLFIDNVDRGFLGLPYSEWYRIHYLGTPILSIFGIIIGTVLGLHYWEEQKVKKSHISKKAHNKKHAKKG